MRDLMNFLQSAEAIMVYVIASVISILYVIHYYIKKTKVLRIRRQNVIELNEMISEEKVIDKDISNTQSDFVEEKQVQLAYIEPVSNIQTSSLVLDDPSIKLDVCENVEEPVIEIIEILSEEKEPVKESVVSLDTPKIVPRNIKNAQLDEALKKINPRKDKIELIREDDTIEIPIINIDNLLAESEKNDILYTSTVPNKEEAKKELEELTKKLEEEENKVITLTEFEQMQEDTAIISLDELMKKAGTMYAQNERNQYKDEGNEPISINDLEKRKVEVSTVSENIPKENKPVRKGPAAVIIRNTKDKFFNSRTISPVYGTKPSGLELENTANYEKLDEEIRKTNEFLATLKELQKKLD